MQAAFQNAFYFLTIYFYASCVFCTSSHHLYTYKQGALCNGCLSYASSNRTAAIPRLSVKCYCSRSGGIVATPNCVFICWFSLLFDDTFHRKNTSHILNIHIMANFLHYYHNLSKLKNLLFYICYIISLFGIFLLIGSKRAKK